MANQGLRFTPSRRKPGSQIPKARSLVTVRKGKSAGSKGG